ncbi:MAG: PASTA domain-containing protein [Acidobacteriaceae bacterium]|nr:PASTA domain-containing protein [Acidobacteriaceae bacterium]
MRAFFRFVLLALVLIVVALVSALTAMRFAIHTREVAVPDLVGKTPFEARRVAELDGFQFEVERQYYSAKIPAGKVLSQVPPAGTETRRGWEIRVAESLGPQRVNIPNVIGESERAAEINILRRGLDLGTVAQVHISGVPVDQIVAQSPSASASSISAPKISLLAAQAPEPQLFVMPSFVGQALSTVTAAIKDAGLQVGKVSILAAAQDSAGASVQAPTPPAQATPASIVASQNPVAGSRVLVGAAIDLEVR